MPQIQTVGNPGSWVMKLRENCFWHPMLSILDGKKRNIISMIKTSQIKTIMAEGISVPIRGLDEPCIL